MRWLLPIKQTKQRKKHSLSLCLYGSNVSGETENPSLAFQQMKEWREWESYLRLSESCLDKRTFKQISHPNGGSPPIKIGQIKTRSLPSHYSQNVSPLTSRNLSTHVIPL